MPDAEVTTSRARRFARLNRVWLVLATLLVVSLGCYALALLVWTAGVASEALRAVGEALLVAVVLGAAGDFYLKYKLAEDSVRRGVETAISETFGFLNPAAPRALQSAVKEFANARLYAKLTVWQVTFDWADRPAGILAVTLKMSNNGCSLYDDGYLPTHDLWVLQSTMHYRTRYLKYCLHSPECGISVDCDELALRSYLSPQNNRLVLDQARLLRDKLGPSSGLKHGAHYHSSRATRMYRHAAGHIPLMHSHFEITCTLDIDGDALEDLKIDVFQPKSADNHHEWRFIGRDADRPMRCQWHGVTPGQATIVSWGLVDPQRTILAIPEQSTKGQY